MEGEIFVFGGKVFVTYDFLFNRNVPIQTVYNNTSKKHKKPWFTLYHPFGGKKKLIEYDSISNEVFESYNLPSSGMLIEIWKTQQAKIKEDREKNTLKHLKKLFDFEVYNWNSAHHFYDGEFEDDTTMQNYCKTHLLLTKCVELKKLGFKSYDLFTAYHLYDDLVFYSINPKSFDNKLRKIINSENPKTILFHGLRNKESNNKKINDSDIIEIKNCFKKSAKLNSDHILQQFNEYLIRNNRETVSISSIYRLIGSRDFKLDAALTRHGARYVQNNILPHAHFVPPRQEGALWCMDGSKFQFVYKTATKNYNILTYYVVIDGRSRRVAGYSYGESETMDVAKEGFKQAVLKTGYIASEIIADDSPAYKPDKYMEIVGKCRLWGVNWRIETNTPTDNVYAEKFFKDFQEEVCKKYPGYIGEGIKTRNLNGKISPEELKKQLSTKKLRTKEQLIDLLDKLIIEYNNSPRREKAIEKALSYKKVPRKKDAIPMPINSIKYCSLFWEEKIIKVRQGNILFKMDKEDFIYNIYDIKLGQYVGQLVKIRYDINDMTNILVFDLKDNYINTIKRYVVAPKVLSERTKEQEQELIKHSIKRKKLLKSLQENSKKIETESAKITESLPPKLGDLINTSKVEREKSEESLLEKELENLKGNEIAKKVHFDMDELSYKELFEKMYDTN